MCIEYINMSLGIDKLDVAVARDPRTNFADDKQMYLIEKPGEDVTQRIIISSTSSESNLNWSAPPPSPSVIVDRKVYAKVYYTFTIGGIQGAIANNHDAQRDNAEYIFNTYFSPNGPGGANNAIANQTIAPRAFPLARSINNLRITINNNSVSTELSDYFHALVHYNTGHDIKHRDYSCTPHMLDRAQTYAQLQGTVRNPLGAFYDNPYEETRRGFSSVSYEFTAGAADQGSMKITYAITELLYLNPLLFDRNSNQKGFIGIQTFDVVMNMESNIRNCLFSAVNNDVVISRDSGAGAADLAFNTITVNISQQNPELHFTYITPNILDMPKISDSIIYPYYNIDRYSRTVSAGDYEPDPNNPNQIIFVGGTPAGGVISGVVSNNIQLNSIPKRIYIFARRNNNTRNKRLEATDTFANISGISFNWNNRNGILSSASEEQLYQMSVCNGLNMSWDDWHIRCGSVLCIDFAKNIGLSSMEAPGLLGTYQMNYSINLKNISTDPLALDLYTVVVSAGTFTISSNRANSQIGVISKQDILDAPDLPLVQYDYDMDGGNFFSGLKKTGRFLKKAAKKVAPLIRKYGPGVADAVGMVAPRASKTLKEVGKAVDPLAKLVGLGYDEEQAMDMMEAMGYLNGRGYVGGKQANKSKLRGRAIGY